MLSRTDHFEAGLSITYLPASQLADNVLSRRQRRCISAARRGDGGQ